MKPAPLIVAIVVAILAFGLTFPVALILFRCLLGLRYLSDLPKLRRAVADRQAAT